MPYLDPQKNRDSAIRTQRRKKIIDREIWSSNWPLCKNPDRRRACERDLRLYLETYHAEDFTLAWSEHHLLLIESIQTAMLEGLQQLVVYPRGSGKTIISRRAVQWATLYGHRKFVVLFAAEAKKAKQHIVGIKKSLLNNEMLYEDFPEVCEPIWQSEGNAMRANYQLYRGEPTQLVWGAEELRFAQLKGMEEFQNQGSAIAVGTITGAAARGPLIENMRPDAAIIDDPQTRASANSPSQVEQRTDIVEGDILGMAGPGKSLSVVCTATVIYDDDMIDRMLDPEQHPDWNGIRISMIQSWPKNEALWDEWYDQVKECKIAGQNHLKPAHAFYRKNRKKMDAGAKVYWPERKRDGYVSALESAMERHYRRPVTFASEYQNRPMERVATDDGMPDKDVLNGRQLRLKRGQMPDWAQQRVCFIDVQQKLLFFMEMAFAADMSCHILRYGTWPEQRRNHFTKSDAKKTMARARPGAGYEGALYHALNQLMNEIERSTGQQLTRGMIDAQYGASTDMVYRVCRERGSNVWYPSHGLGFRVTRKPFGEQTKHKGDVVGTNWRIPRPAVNQRRQRHVVFETNFWKTTAVERWRVPVGDPGAATVHKGASHQLLWDHMHSEWGQRVESNGREIVEWQAKPNEDNDLFDCYVGCCVAASTLGCSPPGLLGAAPRKRKIKRRSAPQVNLAGPEGKSSFFVTAR